MKNQASDLSNSSNSSTTNVDDFIVTTVRALLIGQEMHDNTEVFKIQITDNYHKKTWLIVKDNSDFNILYSNLNLIFYDVPPIPPKQIQTLYDAESVDKKKSIYQEFLTICIKRKDIYSSPEFKYFLGINKNSPVLCGNIPLVGGLVEFLPKSVTDFKFIEDDNINLIAISCAEMGVHNIKTNEEFLNFKNRLQVDNEEIVHNNNLQGMTMVFEIINNEGSFNFIQLWQRKFKTLNTCLYFDNITKSLFIGREDGFVSVHKALVESHYTELDLVIELKNHFSRIIDIWYDANRGKMYTVSNDKRFAVSDVNFDSKMIEINKSVHNYTKLLADDENNRLFAATEGGIIELYSLDKYPPEKRCRIRIHGAGCISDFCYNKINSHLFTCDKSGKISVIEIGGVRKEKTSTQISQFGFKNCLSVIEYIDTRHEIITGDINGKVTVWNIKTGDPIISWIAHKNMVITRISYNKENNILITGSKGKSVKIWKIPEFWYDQKFEEYENVVLTKINNELRKKKIKMEQIMHGNDVNYESEQSENEEDLNGWNYDGEEENIDLDNINAPPSE
jgi:WD40 repeat protein